MLELHTRLNYNVALVIKWLSSINDLSKWEVNSLGIEKLNSINGMMIKLFIIGHNILDKIWLRIVPKKLNGMEDRKSVEYFKQIHIGKYTYII